MLQYFPNFVFSFILGYFLDFGYDKTDIKAYWQPPGYVFGIVWTLLYFIFGFINYNSKLFFKTDNNIIIRQSYFEAILQSLWLIVTARGDYERSSFQYIAGLLILGWCVIYGLFIRLPTLYFLTNGLEYFYYPYLLWIIFAFILNAQLVHISLTG